jgi:tetratricopeptide (TPR) repeat protein
VSLLADVNAGEVRIARSRRPAGVEPATAAAYAAYARGDLATAETRYRALLDAAPGRRDALLGLGAVALARGDRESAFEHYAKVLERYPDDAVASAALVSLTGGHGAATAARLRLLLDRHGELPYLHFALANWYARQGRWADAQQAYFAAFSRDDANPDYAFNLAVSLDRMGQGAAALNYYREALALSDARPARFDPADALERIGALEASPAPPARPVESP